MKILITGATGFVGKELVELLRREGKTVTVVGRDNLKLLSCFPDSSIIKEHTDYSVESLTGLMEGQDIVVHLASALMQRNTHPLNISDFQINLELIQNLVIAADANNIHRLINISSISVYPLGSKVTELQPACPWNIYGVSKANADTYLLYANNKTKVELVSLRLARLFGDGERSGLMFTEFVDRARRGESLEVYGDGSSTIEYIYIQDAIAAILAVVQADKLQGIYNVGAGRSYSVLEIAEVVNEVFENVKPIKFIDVNQHPVKGTVMEVGKLKSAIGWCPQWTLLQSVMDIKLKR